MILPPRLTRSVAAGAVLSAAVLGLGSSQGAAAASPEATAALAWLADELDATADGVFVYDSGFGDFTDYGLTLDAVLALTLGGGHGAVAGASLDAVEADIASYVTDADFGDGSGRFAGALAKGLVAQQLAGRDGVVGPDDLDLEEELRALERPTSDTRRAGRLSDTPDDYSNGVGMALGVMALARTTGGVPDGVVDFFLEQQCPGGGFRTIYDEIDPTTFEVDEASSTRGCESADRSDLDGTSFALQALVSIRDEPGVAAAISAAVGFLTAPANATDNANSAGLAGQALRAAGATAAADGNAAKVVALQLPNPGPDAGAIAFDADAKAAAAGSTIAPADLSQFWRATAQGVLALGLPSYGPGGVPPAPTTTTTAATDATTTSTVAGSTTSTSGAAATSTTAKAAGSGTIAKTGASARAELLVGLFLVGVGLASVGQARLRSRPSP